MPLSESLAVLPISDRSVFEKLKTVVGLLPALNPNATSLTWSLGGSGTPLNSSCPLKDADANRTWQSILSEDTELCSSISISFQLPSGQPMPQNGSSGSVGFSRLQDGYCTVTYHFPDVLLQTYRDSATEVVIRWKKEFASVSKSTIVSRFAPEVADFYAARESSLIRLEELTSNLLKEADEQRRERDAEFDRLKSKLEEKYAQSEARLQEEFDVKDQALKAREEALLQRQKELDQADNTQARRKIRQDLKKVLEERHAKFTLTEDTSRKRTPILIAFSFLITLTLSLAAFFAWALSQPLASGIPTWVPALKLGLSAAGCASALVFFIRWQNRWAQIHADEEFRLKRFDLDVDRASWLVEMIFEWKNQEGRDIPPELIKRLGAGLFENVVAVPDATHPVEDVIAALLGSAASLNVKLPGGEVLLDRKAVAKAEEKIK